jgi:hypothetical protein
MRVMAPSPTARARQHRHPNRRSVIEGEAQRPITAGGIGAPAGSSLHNPADCANNFRTMWVDGVSAFALVAADRARDEGERSLMRRRAHERLEEIGRDLGDWAALGELSGERWEQARAIMREEIAAACDWWRAQLAEQGHAPDRVEVLVREYRGAFMRGLRGRMIGI